MSNTTIEHTDFHFPGQKTVAHGKVRDVYDLGDSLLLVASDRYSAFDRNLALVPDKGRLLTAISHWWFKQTEPIIRNHVKALIDPNVLWCDKYQVVPIEMVVRGYITGVTNTSLWHTYSDGQRDYGTFVLPDGLYKNQALPEPVLTPTTKFEAHDRNLTPEQAAEEGLISHELWDKLQRVALELFAFGQRTARERGLILVDTKYEFGLDKDGGLVLIDEIHTPDSSRYWKADSYEARIAQGEEPDYYDKEYMRVWYKERFDPYSDAEPPEASPELIDELRRRYISVYEQLTGESFTVIKIDEIDPLKRMEANIIRALQGGE